MTIQTSETEINYLSHDGVTQIRALLFEPVLTEDAVFTGIVQIAHGMAEHSERYRDFACFLAEHGFIVCINDHLGHGKSVASSDDWGCLPVKGGKDILIEDFHQLRTLVQANYASELPYIAFGHSMGSFVVRSYCAHHGEGLAGAIICGTAQQPLAISRIAHALATLIARVKGADYRSKFLDNMGVGGFSKIYKKPRTPLDWLSVNEANVDAYIADPACGFMFSVGGYATLTTLMIEVAKTSCARKIPLKLPLLFIAGQEDPVGAHGKGVLKAANQLRQTGHTTVDTWFYAGLRHEILNESDNAEVYQNILNWLENLEVVVEPCPKDL
jgi:alpha-beta hydrolase superfamily lysophospholipase